MCYLRPRVVNSSFGLQWLLISFQASEATLQNAQLAVVKTAAGVQIMMAHKCMTYELR
jgi:hypothetical protein